MYMSSQRALDGALLQFVKASIEPLLVFDEAGMIQLGNAALLRLLALDMGDLVGHSLNRIFRHEAQTPTELIRVASELQLVGLCGDARECAVAMNITPITVGGRWVAIARVMPVASQTGRHDEWSLYRLFELSADMLCVIDFSGHFTWVNPAFGSILGYSPTSMLGTTVFEYVHVEEVVHTQQVFADLARGDTSRYCQHRFRCNNESYKWLSWNIVRGDGMLYAVGRDVTERKRVEAELRLASRVIDDSQDGIMIIDRQRKIRRINRAFTRLTGFADADVIGRNLGVLDGGRQGASFYRDLWRHVRRSGGWQGEVWGRRKSGDVYPQWLSVSAILDPEGRPKHYVGIFADISEKKRSEERIQRLAHYDAVTGLPNRVLFQERLERACIQAQRLRAGFAVMFIDLDRFKAINDSLGHAVGDELLAVVGQRLLRSVRSEDTVSRRGGDEFTVILQGLSDHDSAVRSAAFVAEKMLHQLTQPMTLVGHETFVTASIGVSLFPQDAADIGELIKNADAAMYHAKKQGRNNYQFYSADMNARAKQRLSLETRLRNAVEREELRVFYQPQVDLLTGEIVGAEALVRWQHPELGLLSPTHFMPLAEETGLVLSIGDWVLDQACRQYRAWEQAGHGIGKVSVNISPRQFNQGMLVQRIDGVMGCYDIPYGALELEILESTYIDNSNSKTLMSVCELSEMGVCLAIDDFGTGYSSLSYLKRFPVQVLKIDQSFTRDMVSDANSAAIVKAILSMAQNLELNVIAEGIETEAQLHFLQDHGCRQGQGFLFARPVPAEQFTQFCFRDLHALRPAMAS
jgi:diguanylate cyclase (GGDEF)-like protein/PAS domain S-box-containing protein